MSTTTTSTSPAELHPPGYSVKPQIDPGDSAVYRLKSKLQQRVGRGPELPDRNSFRVEPTHPSATAGLGICRSGGGIRAAALRLGALQSLGRHGLLWGPHKAMYLAAVSA